MSGPRLGGHDAAKSSDSAARSLFTMLVQHQGKVKCAEFRAETPKHGLPEVPRTPVCKVWLFAFAFAHSGGACSQQPLQRFGQPGFGKHGAKPGPEPGRQPIPAPGGVGLRGSKQHEQLPSKFLSLSVCFTSRMRVPWPWPSTRQCLKCSHRSAVFASIWTAFQERPSTSTLALATRSEDLALVPVCPALMLG